MILISGLLKKFLYILKINKLNCLYWIGDVWIWTREMGGAWKSGVTVKFVGEKDMLTRRREDVLYYI